MKTKRDYITFLEDMYDAVCKGILFTNDMTYEQFETDDKTQYAVIRAIEIIGEASKKIPENIRTQSIEIPWTNVSGMRDVLIHDYFGVNIRVVWETAKKDLPDLKKQLHLLIKDLK
ncbi:MAG: DUF86 domain-containing protein [Ignavibacteriota bacterium]